MTIPATEHRPSFDLVAIQWEKHHLTGDIMITAVETVTGEIIPVTRQFYRDSDGKDVIVAGPASTKEWLIYEIDVNDYVPLSGVVKN